MLFRRTFEEQKLLEKTLQEIILSAPQSSEITLPESLGGLQVSTLPGLLDIMHTKEGSTQQPAVETEQLPEALNQTPESASLASINAGFATGFQEFGSTTKNLETLFTVVSNLYEEAIKAGNELPGSKIPFKQKLQEVEGAQFWEHLPDSLVFPIHYGFLRQRLEMALRRKKHLQREQELSLRVIRRWTPFGLGKTEKEVDSFFEPNNFIEVLKAASYGDQANGMNSTDSRSKRGSPAAASPSPPAPRYGAGNDYDEGPQVTSLSAMNSTPSPRYNTTEEGSPSLSSPGRSFFFSDNETQGDSDTFGRWDLHGTPHDADVEEEETKFSPSDDPSHMPWYGTQSSHFVPTSSMSRGTELSLVGFGTDGATSSPVINALATGDDSSDEDNDADTDEDFILVPPSFATTDRGIAARSSSTSQESIGGTPVVIGQTSPTTPGPTTGAGGAWSWQHISPTTASSASLPHPSSIPAPTAPSPQGPAPRVGSMSAVTPAKGMSPQFSSSNLTTSGSAPLPPPPPSDFPSRKTVPTQPPATKTVPIDPRTAYENGVQTLKALDTEINLNPGEASRLERETARVVEQLQHLIVQLTDPAITAARKVEAEKGQAYGDLKQKAAGRPTALAALASFEANPESFATYESGYRHDAYVNFTTARKAGEQVKSLVARRKVLIALAQLHQPCSLTLDENASQDLTWKQLADAVDTAGFLNLWKQLSPSLQ